MADRSIIFSGPMVRALLEGRKSQTRRVLKPQPKFGFVPWQDEDTKEWFQSGYGEAGDDVLVVPFAIGGRLWVRETWADTESEHPAVGARNLPDQGHDWPTSYTLPARYWLAARAALTRGEDAQDADEGPPGDIFMEQQAAMATRLSDD